MASPAQNADEVLLAPFLQLSTREEQREALRGLARHLTYDHFRTLSSVKDSSVVDNLDCYFHYDIIAELPVEISQKIFLYLPLYQCFKAQRVSRRWRKLLSAPKTIECLIRWWYPKGETDLGIPYGISIKAVMNLKAEHIDAFRTGHPFSNCILGGVPDDLAVPPVGGIAYTRGVLAWINPDPYDGIARSIATTDLKTHLRKHFIPEDRTSFHTIAISSSIIAALDHAGRCHIWDICHSNRICLLRLPSAGYDRMEISGPALAIASSGQNTNGKIEVLTWSFQSMKTQSFLLPLQPVQVGVCPEWKIMFDPKGESLFLFQTIRSKRYVATKSCRDVYEMYFTRTALDGQIRAQGQSEWLSSTYSLSAFYGDSSMKIRTVEVSGSATLWVFYPLFYNYVPNSHRSGMILTRIGFNFERSSFEVAERRFASGGLDPHCISSLSIWKDIIYWGDPANTDSRIIDLKESTCGKTKLASNPNLRSYVNNLKGAGQDLILGDETFLIHVAPKGWNVWCFDTNIQMADEDLGYRYRRLENIQKHILPRVP